VIDVQPLGGRTDQEFVARGAIDRRTARHAFTLSSGLLALCFLAVVGLIGIGMQSHEKPVILKQLADGSYMPYTENVTPDEASKTFMLTTWFACFRTAGDPKSVCGTTTAALLDARSAQGVVTQVQTYNQQVADEGATVTPHIDAVLKVPTAADEYQVRWDETVKVGVHTEVRSMLATVTVAFADSNVNMHRDVLTNPFGMYIQDLTVIDAGVKK
jgi:hypothetical protein